LSKYDYIFFDLDGTLTDPKEGIINSYIHAVNKLGLTEDDKECITYYFGAPLHQYFADKHSLKDGQLDSAIAIFREYFSEKGLYENFLYPGIAEMLDRLNLSGRTIYLVTVKPTHFAKIILEHFNIDKYFYGIYGSDLTTVNKSKEELIEALLLNEGVKCENCVMVGDRHHDVLGAKHNKVTSMAVTYGYGSIDELNDCKPDHIVNSVGELLKKLL
jgi:phosphoglycolate phosphatase